MESKNREWVQIVKKYQRADTRKAIWQLINTAVPYLALFAVNYYAMQYSFWLFLPVAILSAGFMVRLFIIQHDCGHNSFLPSTKWNDILGVILGIFTLTPYFRWRKSHAIHHATAGDLDLRGIGDVDTLTVDEYFALPWYRRLLYRVYRNPLFMFGISSTLLFVVVHRLPVETPKEWKKERRSVHLTNLGIALMLLVGGALMGYGRFLLMYLVITIFASTAGVWLFWIQHQFEDTYWRRHKEWDYEKAALEGASYLKLPRVLQWFSGNIGFHHIHHLAPKIPNYLLEKAYKETPMFQKAYTLTFWTGMRTMFTHLWDEEGRRLISFAEAYRLRRTPAATAA